MSSTSRLENGQIGPKRIIRASGYLRDDGIYPQDVFGPLGRSGAAFSGSPYTDPFNYVVFQDDFLGTALRPEWTALDTGAATEALLTDESEANGVVALTLTNADEAQRAALTFNDIQPIPLAKKPVMDILWKLKVLPVLGTEASYIRFGLGSAYNVSVDGAIADGAFMGFTAHASTNGVLRCMTNSDVGGSGSQTAAASSVTAANTEWHWSRIDLSNQSSVKFFDCVQSAGSGNVQSRLCSTTTFSLAGRTTYVQPILSAAKSKSSANTSTGQIYIDCVRVMWQR